MMNHEKLLAATMVLFTLMICGCNDDSSAKVDLETPSQTVASAQVQGKFPAFNTKTIDGATVTDQIFADKRVTVLNVWGTFCPPCIDEMPELGTWAKMMPPDVQLIGLVCDVADEYDDETINTARQILKESHADFVNIIPNAQLRQILSNIEAVPTTIFINDRGEIIGDPIIGADVDGYIQRVEELLQ